MAFMLETLAPGTPVFAGETHVGYVRALYAVKGTRAASTVVVDWTSRAEEVGVPATEVESIDETGVHLMSAQAENYLELPPFEEARFPTLERLDPA